MKSLVKLGIIAPLLYSSSLFALHPVEGFYVGLIGEVSHGPSNSQIYFREDNMVFRGEVDYSSIAGGAGLMLGYKFRHFRAEGEFLYNRISTGPLTVGTCTLQSPNVQTPTGFCPAGVYDDFQAKALGYTGNSSAMYGLFNAYWDFFSEAGTSDWAPYLGFGVGIGSVKNGSSFVNTLTNYSHGQTHTGSGMAYQGILGVNYFMDDFTWCSIDYRLLNTTQRADTRADLGTHLPSKDYTLNTINLTINAAFDKGAIS